MKKIFATFIAALIFVACGDENSIKNHIKTGDIITFTSHDNQKLQLQRNEHGFSLVGSDKALLIDVFGTFCRPCQQEAPELFMLSNELKDKLIVLGLSYAEDADNEKLKEFSKNYNAYYFLSSHPQCDEIVDLIASDIDYSNQVLLPFKVLIKDGEYQKLGDKLYILGIANKDTIKNSIKEIK